MMQIRTEPQQADPSKQSVLKWAGSSLKTMGKKLRKPLLSESEAPPAAKQTQQTPANSGFMTPRQIAASRPAEALPGVFTPAVRQLHIQVPPVEVVYGDLQPKVSRFSLYPLLVFSFVQCTSFVLGQLQQSSCLQTFLCIATRLNESPAAVWFYRAEETCWPALQGLISEQ